MLNKNKPPVYPSSPWIRVDKLHEFPDFPSRTEQEICSLKITVKRLQMLSRNVMK